MRVASSMLVLAAAMALPVGARAAEADTMSVTGQITAQNGCSMSIQNGGNINFGVVPASSISWGQYATNFLDASVNCTTPTYIAIQLVNMRPGAGENGLEQLGLGLARNGERVGYYTVHVEQDQFLTLNGITGRMLGDPSPGPGIGAFWLYRSVDPWNNLGWRSFGYTDGYGAEEPVSVANFKFRIRTYLTPPGELELTGALPIDGQFILEMMYM